MHILITGASRGLGLALARSLAQRGATLIITARGAAALDQAAQELSAYTTVQALSGDVSDPAHQQALAAAVAELGGLDVLVNNASILGPSPQPFLKDYPAADFRHVFKVNTFAPLELVQLLAPQLNQGARILNLSSDAAVAAYAGWGGYGAAKAALDHVSAILAAEHPEWRIYAVDPGDMNTQMHQEAFPGEDISDRPAPETSVPGLLKLIDEDLPSGRYVARELMEPHPLKQLRIILNVADYPAAVQLYRDAANLAEIDSWDRHDGRGIVFDAGRVQLEVLEQRHADAVDLEEAGRTISGPVRIAWQVADLAGAANHLLTHGATMVNDPVQTSWGDQVVRLQVDQQQITLFVQGESA